MWEKVKFKSLVDLLLPTFLRKERLRAFLYAMIHYIDKIYMRWIRFIDDNIYKLNHNGQVFSLEKVLNDRFDYSKRRIRIVTINREANHLYIYTVAEHKSPIYIGLKYINTLSEISYSETDFIVEVPKQIEDKDVVISSIIRQYKIFGTTFKIVRV